LIQHLSRYGQR